MASDLRELGMSAFTVESGAVALDTLARESFDLVLMDWCMPEMDGLEASKRIRENTQLAKTPVVVMVTAFGREEVAEEAQRIGIQGFLIKPVRSSLLLHVILETFGKETPRAVYAVGPTAQAEVDFHGAHVLLVEDNEINRQVARAILGEAGISMDEACDGFEAVAAVDRKDYAAILMDIQMPGMDGYEATKCIRENPRHKGLPIIAMTAHAMSGCREECLAAGMDDYVSKPVEPEALFKVLAKWLLPGTSSEGKAVAKMEIAIQNLPDDDLPGVDLPAGLRRLGGDRGLYFKLLGDLIRDHCDTQARIRLALNEGRLDDAARHAHTLRGVAANLSIPGVQSAAADVERCLKQGDALEVTSRLIELGEAFGIVMQGYRRRFPEKQESLLEVVPDDAGAPRDRSLPSALRPSLERLLALVRKRNPNAEIAFSEMRKDLEQVCLVAVVRQLDAAFETFDFKAAAAQIEAILAG